MWRAWQGLLLCVALIGTACEAGLSQNAPSPSPATTLSPAEPAGTPPSFYAQDVAASARAMPPALASTPLPVATPHNPAAVPRLEEPGDLPEAILTYLNSGSGSADVLKPALSAWGLNVDPLPYAPGSDVVMRGDVDGDGQSDLVVALGQASPSSCETGALVLYLARGSTFHLAQQIGLLEPVPIDPQISHVPCPALLAVRDLINDGRAQIVYTSTHCAAHTCDVSVGVLRWNGAELRPVMTEPLPTMANPQVGLEDAGQGTFAIVMHGGIISSTGAGPQRERREIYRWNGSRFALAERTFDPSNFLYFKVSDANSLMLQKHYTEAIQLYQQAIGDPRLELSGMHAAERADLEAFSRFRLIVAYALLADEAAAQAALADMSATQPGHVYYEVAQAFWAAYLPQHNIAAGCAAVGRLARASPSLTDVLSDYGYTHTDLTAADVCPFPL